LSENKGYWGDMSYDELYKAWSSKYNFGGKGELTLSEAKEIHARWKALGSAAKAGLI
jgi:hypothetical protein